jgi:hypothetical protein
MESNLNKDPEQNIPTLGSHLICDSNIHNTTQIQIPDIHINSPLEIRDTTPSTSDNNNISNPNLNNPNLNNTTQLEIPNIHINSITPVVSSASNNDHYLPYIDLLNPDFDGDEISIPLIQNLNHNRDNDAYEEQKNEERRIFENEMNVNTSLNNITIRDQIAQGIRDALISSHRKEIISISMGQNITNDISHESHSINRQPPAYLINPMQMARSKRGPNSVVNSIEMARNKRSFHEKINSSNLLKQDSSDTMIQSTNSTNQNTRRPATAITPLIASETHMGFGDAMEQYLRLNQPSDQQLDRTNQSVGTPNQFHDSSSDVSDSDSSISDPDSDSSDSELNEVFELDWNTSTNQRHENSKINRLINQSTQSNLVTHHQDGWIDFTTAAGLQEALRLIREDNANNANYHNNHDNNHKNHNNHDVRMNNLDTMYFDPETGDEYHRINGVWRNITTEISTHSITPRNNTNTDVTRSNSVTTANSDTSRTNPITNIISDTNHNEGVVDANILEQQNISLDIFDLNSDRFYHNNQGQYVPLTINTPSDPETVSNYITTAINNDEILTQELGNVHNTTHVTETVGQMGERSNINDKQLTININTNVVLGNSINTMALRQQTISQIPTIPTPTTVQGRPTRSNIPVPAIPPQGQNAPGLPRVPVVPVIRGAPAPAPAPATTTVTPVPIPVPTTVNPGLPNGRQNNPIAQTTGQAFTLPQPGRLNPDPVQQINRVTVPQVPVVTVPPLGRNMNPIILPINKQETEFVPPELPAENPYRRVPRAVLDAIAQERDITLTGNNNERAEQLYEFDHIMPDWIQSIMTKTVENFQMLTGSKLYVFGALNRVSFDGLTGLQNRDLVNYIRVSILMNTPNHPGRELLPTLVNNLHRNVLEIFAGRLAIPHTHLKFINTEELRRAIITGSTDHIANETINIVVQRYNLLTNHKYSRLIDELYQIGGDDDLWINIARMPPHPMEGVILGLDNFTSAQIINTFGMSVPLSHSNNVKRYIENNIVAYAPILTRGTLDPIPLDVMTFMSSRELTDYIEKLTDTEIWSTIGVYVPYTSRNELVANIVNCITRPRFMYPTTRSITRSDNKTTIMGSDITDTTVFMVCYGTALKYHVYELYDLTGAFHRDDNTQAMEFRRPENIRTKFSVQDIEGLRQLLNCFPVTAEINALNARIDEGLIDAKEKIAYDDIARTQLRAFDEPTRLLIQQFLRQIFYTGMYMRRWVGPGNPFPLKADTTRTTKEPDAKVTEQLGIGIELLKQMDDRPKNFCLNLKICEYNGQGGIEHGQAVFNGEWNGVIKGDNCIRMASSKFVGTGYHYLRALFRETIPGMDVKAVDRIV